MMRGKMGFYACCLKRPLDFLLALGGLIFLSPLLLFLGLLVRVRLGSPVLFRQERPGLGERIFTLYKFRTMSLERDGEGRLLPDSQRLTRLGGFLRSTSLDELPELFNILRGEMSFVGPRPLLTLYLKLYNPEQRRRHEVRPGLSGLAQVRGRNGLSWEERFALDVAYVDSVTFLGDLKILLLTLKKVFVREGISSSSSVTMEPFQGYSSPVREIDEG